MGKNVRDETLAIPVAMAENNYKKNSKWILSLSL
jgi:hypothetical protein